MKKLPRFFETFQKNYPSIARAYEAFSTENRRASGYERREAELIKLALAVGATLEGAVHSHARRALDAGATAEQLRGVALLAMTTCGFPHAMMGLSWIEDVLPSRRSRRES